MHHINTMEVDGCWGSISVHNMTPNTVHNVLKVKRSNSKQHAVSIIGLVQLQQSSFSFSSSNRLSGYNQIPIFSPATYVTNTERTQIIISVMAPTCNISSTST